MPTERTERCDELVEVLRANPDLRRRVLAAVNDEEHRGTLQQQLVTIAKDRRLREVFRRTEYRVGSHFISRVGVAALGIAAFAVVLRLVLPESDISTSITTGLIYGAGAAIALVVGLHLYRLVRPSSLLVSITLPPAAARAEELVQERPAPSQ